MTLVRALIPLGDPALLQALGSGRALVLDAMLGEQAAAGVREAALRLDVEGGLRPAGIGRDATTVPSVRGDRIAWLDPDAPPEGLRPVLELMSATMATLNETAYVGAEVLECQLAIYDEGSGYQRHRDAVRGTSSRRITAVYYANPWRPGDGGELELYDEEDGRGRRVEPISDRLVVFRSDITDHAVRPLVRGPRVALSAFFRRGATL